MTLAHMTFPAAAEAEPRLSLVDEAHGYDPRSVAEGVALTIDSATAQGMGLDPSTVDPLVPPSDETFEEYRYSRHEPLTTEGLSSTPLSVTMEAMANFTLRSTAALAAARLCLENERLATDSRLNGQRATLQFAHSMHVRSFLQNYFLELNPDDKQRLQSIVDSARQQR